MLGFSPISTLPISTIHVPQGASTPKGRMVGKSELKKNNNSKQIAIDSDINNWTILLRCYIEHRD